MKKRSLLAIILIVFAFSSCKKDRQCECITTITDASGTQTTMPAQTTTYKKIKKSDAKSICQKRLEIDESNSGAITTTTDDCKLK